MPAEVDVTGGVRGKYFRQMPTRDVEIAHLVGLLEELAETWHEAKHQPGPWRECLTERCRRVRSVLRAAKVTA
jgi:hypothetical protein